MRTNQIRRKEYEDCLQCIERYWAAVTRHEPKDRFVHIGMPNKFVCPNAEIYRDDQFYWDSYFIITGLVVSDRVSLAKGMIDNLLALQKRFNIIPMRNRFYNIGTSQLPLLTSMIEEVYSHDKDKAWRSRCMKAAERELREYWMNYSLPEIHIVHRGLSRYCDHFITHAAAEHESGWDMTSRFDARCLDILPVDLNAALYKYEVDLAEYYRGARNPEAAAHWTARAAERMRTINELMWDEHSGFFFDYDYLRREQRRFRSVAGYYPLWAGLASQQQAERMRAALGELECEYGIANTQPDGLAPSYHQHDHPNGWPQQQWIVVKGLLKYGFREDAERIAQKFLNLTASVFRQTGELWEKYNVVTGRVADSERYPTQSGFGWTNAVFLRLLTEFAD